MGLFFFCFVFCAQLRAESPMLIYKINPQLSEMLIYTTNSGFLAEAGHKLEIKVHDISGTLKLDPKSLSTGVLEMKVVSHSLKVNNSTPEKDKKEIEETLCDKVLECDSFPFITFKSTEVDTTDPSYSKITGDFTLHGVTHRIPLMIDISQENNQIEAKGEFKLKQSDFKIKPPSALGGTLKVKDEIKITFHIVARP